MLIMFNMLNILVYLAVLIRDHCDGLIRCRYVHQVSLYTDVTTLNVMKLIWIKTIFIYTTLDYKYDVS